MFTPSGTAQRGGATNLDSPDFLKGLENINATNAVDYNPAESFKKFMPRSEKKKKAKDMLDELSDFMYTPRRFFCQKHKDTEIEYCCKINEKFYCRLCLPGHHGHDDTVLVDICRQIQEDVIKLKHTYISKKQFMVEKLDKHQEKIESLFKVYYDTLDDLRNQYLGQEYNIRETMDSFERMIQGLMKDIKKYNYIEFYHEQYNLQQ